MYLNISNSAPILVAFVYHRSCFPLLIAHGLDSKRHFLQPVRMLNSSVRVSVKSITHCSTANPEIGTLHDPLTWYKITHTGEQVAEWDFQNKCRSRWTGTSCIVFLGSLTAQLAHQYVWFCTMLPDRAKGLFHIFSQFYPPPAQSKVKSKVK